MAVCMEWDSHFLFPPTVCGCCDYIRLHCCNGNKTGVKPDLKLTPSITKCDENNCLSIARMIIWNAHMQVSRFKSKTHVFFLTSLSRRNLFCFLQNSVCQHIINTPHIKPTKQKYEEQNHNMYEAKKKQWLALLSLICRGKYTKLNMARTSAKYKKVKKIKQIKSWKKLTLNQQKILWIVQMWP